MRQWDTSCPDWEARLLAGTSLVPTLPLFNDEADRAENILRRLRLYDVIGTPTMAEAGCDWLFPIVRALFGSYDKEAQRRMIQEVFLLICKKNAKTSYAALIMLTAIMTTYRPAAEGTFFAPTKDIADRAFKQVRGAIRLDPVLTDIFHVQDNIKRVTNRRNDAVLEVKSADVDVATGLKSTFVLIDETHVFAAHSKAADVFTEIRGALTARPDGFLFQITTQSKAPPSGVFKDELHRARNVRDGKRTGSLLPVLYEFPEQIVKSEDWKAPEFWHLVNPNMGKSVNMPFLREQFDDANEKGPAALALFSSQHLNIEIGVGLKTDRWPGAEYWAKRSDPALTIETLVDRCDVIVVGLDGGGLDDLYGVCFLGRDAKTKVWLAVFKAWAHKSVFERRKSIAPTLNGFVKDGHLIVIGDELDDVTQIVGLIKFVKDSGRLGAVAADPAGLGEMVDSLAEIDVTQENNLLKGAPQGYAMMNAIKTAERKVANGTMIHDGSPLAAWCVGNLKIEPTATAIRATKQNAGDAKIDPAMAMFNAVTVMSLNPAPQGAPAIFAI